MKCLYLIINLLNAINTKALAVTVAYLLQYKSAIDTGNQLLFPLRIKQVTNSISTQ